jgi:hypothetical protein
MISPNEVVQEMAFSSVPRQESPLRPQAKPPSSAPPLPPPPTHDEEVGLLSTSSERDEYDALISYQHQQQHQQQNGNTTNNNGRARAAAMPAIHHYDETDCEPDPRVQYLTSIHGAAAVSSGFRGDASWRPNTGETNVYDTAIFGLALHELLDNLRLTNVCAGLTSILLLASTWLFKLVTLAIDKLVLSCYLAFLATALLAAELIQMYRIDVWSLHAQLRQNFGLLYHPPGKIFFCYLLASLSWGIGGVWEFLLGWVYFASASILLYVWASYPEYRNLFRNFNSDDDDDEARRRGSAPRSNSWSYFGNSLSSFNKVSPGEVVGLLDSSTTATAAVMRHQHSGPV